MSNIKMREIFRALFLLFCIEFAFLTEPPCVIELECAECIPDNMPLVTSPRAANGSVLVPAGAALQLSCGAGRLLAYPLRSALAAVCEAGRFRVQDDGALRHLLELGCQENVFEDALHSVEFCASPLQGRVYRTMEPDSQGSRHLAALCFDEDRGVTTFAHATDAPGNALRLPPHDERGAPLSLFGNFNRMFDASTRDAAEKLHSDDERTNRRLRELLKHERVSLADQTLTSARLLSPRYYEDQNARVTEFVSNKAIVWRSVAAGNLRHLQRDVARLLRAAGRRGALHVFAGTHGAGALRTAHGRAPLLLRGGRFPVPRYVWTVVYDERSARALAVAVLNDPFVAVSEIRESVFCESACGRVPWLHELRRARNYESPLYGLAFCCEVHNFTAAVPEMPAGALAAVPPGERGMLTELYT
ncbi:uncharacterized protein [Epargyreus clarus]|uniref:uncharacterized protein n=1 Tax=Epargyreus clarus TaxID=520877 RepID=UPI003C2F79B3